MGPPSSFQNNNKVSWPWVPVLLLNGNTWPLRRDEGVEKRYEEPNVVRRSPLMVMYIVNSSFIKNWSSQRHDKMAIPVH